MLVVYDDGPDLPIITLSIFYKLKVHSNQIYNHIHDYSKDKTSLPYASPVTLPQVRSEEHEDDVNHYEGLSHIQELSWALGWV